MRQISKNFKQTIYGTVEKGYFISETLSIFCSEKKLRIVQNLYCNFFFNFQPFYCKGTLHLFKGKFASLNAEREICLITILLKI